jgi:LysM repeat protein
MTEGEARGLGPLWSGLIAAALVALTLAVAVILGVQEQGLVAQVEPEATSTAAAPTATMAVATATSLSPTRTDREPFSPTPEVATSSVSSPSPMPTPTPAVETACVVTMPVGWHVYVVKSGDTLGILAQRYNTTESQLMQVNCLASNSLLGVSSLYVPNVAPSEDCYRPFGWVDYIVRSGDTLFELARAVGVSVDRLKQGNCLTDSTITTGTILWLPRYPVPTRVPLPTHTPAPTAVSTVTPSPTSAMTLTPEGSQTPGPTTTETATPEPTTGSPTATAEPSSTTSSPTATSTPSEPTRTSEPTATPTRTSEPTVTLTNTSPPPADSPVPPSDTPVTPPPAGTP